MGIGLDVYECSFCSKPRKINAEKRKSLRRGAKNLFCDKSCATKFKNKHNNPMNSLLTRKKLSENCRSRKAWIGESNPNYGGDNIKNLWQEGRYDSRDFSGDKNPAWIDGRSFEQYGRGPDWNIQRRKALKRDSFSCQNCFSENNIVVHHKIPYALTQDNNLKNLKTLCRSCHGEEHMKIGWNYFSKIGVETCLE